MSVKFDFKRNTENVEANPYANLREKDETKHRPTPSPATRVAGLLAPSRSRPEAPANAARSGKGRAATHIFEHHKSKRYPARRVQRNKSKRRETGSIWARVDEEAACCRVSNAGAGVDIVPGVAGSPDPTSDDRRARVTETRCRSGPSCTARRQPGRATRGNATRSLSPGVNRQRAVIVFSVCVASRRTSRVIGLSGPQVRPCPFQSLSVTGLVELGCYSGQ